MPVNEHRTPSNMSLAALGTLVETSGETWHAQLALVVESSERVWPSWWGSLTSSSKQV